MTIGGRLKEERNRLRLSQTEFAAIAGTTKKSQIEYEKDSTYPNAAYLSSVAASGADVQYIITGVRSDMALTPDERQLLELFRAAPLTGKMAAVGALQGVLNPGTATTVIATGNAQAAGRDIHYALPTGKVRTKTK